MALGSSSGSLRYDVYLSFSEDTRTNFIAYLVAALQGRGALTFLDLKLKKGETIGHQHIQAIEQSQSFIVVLSKNYASFPWYLDELQKIMESKQNLGQPVFPVFYHVEPSDIRHQKGHLGKDFVEHEERFSHDEIRRWREALTEVANLFGWLVKDENEAEVVERIAQDVCAQLYDISPSNIKPLVGGFQSKVDIPRMALSSASSSSNPPTQSMRYDVYLSFRGEDTRRNFTAHLYAALQRKGIVTFWDEKLMKKGEAIWDQIIRAIEQSRFSIVVLSMNYTSSLFCLNELLKIMESRRELGRLVVPVFYDVQPSDIRRQRGDIAKHFKEYERRFSHDTIQGWRAALTEVANVSGWHVKHEDEREVVERIAQDVWTKLCDKSPSNFEPLVGDIQSKVYTIISLLKIGVDDICFIGIWGMGGIGKTILAQVVYEKVQNAFDAYCFLSNIREDSERLGLVNLQKKLLSHIGRGEWQINDCYQGAGVIKRCLRHKRVLIVLDDVSHRSHLENLAGNKEWFGAGSKIIITTRDKTLLTWYEQFEAYEVGTLHPDASLQLFCRKAFEKDYPEEGYLDLSKKVVEHACGLPLALVILGSFLCRRTQSEWRDALKKLSRILPKDIIDPLRISYGGLEDEEDKAIFLDIACFFNGRKKTEVINILKICGLHPEIGIQVLIEKSLLSSSQSNSNLRYNAEEGQNLHDRLQKMRRDIFLPTFMYHKFLHEASQESLHMHDFLQQMGRDIVFEESPNNAGRRSRLWSRKDVDLVLKGNQGTEQVQRIILDLKNNFDANWHPDCFSRMQNLSLLDLSRIRLVHNLNSLPSALKYLRWDHYALEYLPSIEQSYELESLQLCSSNIKKPWDRTPSLYKLRIIDLSYSDDLMETPDFSGTPNLEKLFLNYCGSLIRVHESVGQLKKLVELSLLYCTDLETLPTYLEMNNLEVFILGECSKLAKLPDFGKNMSRLYFLDLRKTDIIEIPSSIIHLINLNYLDLSGCDKLKSMPKLLPNLIIRASNHLFLESTLELQYLIASHFLKGPIHLFSDFKVFHEREGIPGWFEQQEYRYLKDNAGEVVTITADIPNDMADCEGECWGIDVCIVFECLHEEAWRGFSINWEFKDYYHTIKDGRVIIKEKEKKGGRPHRTRARSQVDLTTNTNRSTKAVDDIPQDGIECRVYRGFYPIDKEHCRPHPSGKGSQVDLTLTFPTTNTIGNEIIHSRERYFGNLEIVDCGWRLGACKKDLDASMASTRHEAEIIEDTAKFVWDKSSDELPPNFKHLVGDIPSKVDRITSLLNIRSDDKCFLGIWGMGGIGKTALAQVVYDAIRSNFDASCFLANVREDSERYGLVFLQQKLLSNLGQGERVSDSFEGAEIIRKLFCHKKVLIILDDISHGSQLENLAGNKEWFGAGSKIIMTTRDIKLLTLYEQFEVYEVGILDPKESFQLFCQNAFRKDGPEVGYLDLSKKVVEHACGLPLALKVLGSFLYMREQSEWREALDEWSQHLHKDIFYPLRISFDGLEEEEYKTIFLDIACFFNKKAKFKVTNILKICGLHSTIGIEILIKKSMLSLTQPDSESRQNAEEGQDMHDRIHKMRREFFLPTYLYDWFLREASKEYLYMHHLLQVMGRDIVCQKSPTNAGGRRRLWSLEDIDLVLKENTGTETVQSIVLDIQEGFEANWHPDCFSNMQNLILLDLSKVHLSCNLNSLPSALKILRWDYYVLESLPPIDQLYELESLQLCNSKIRKLWNVTPSLIKLRTIDLSDSECLIETPDFSGTPNLEELLLSGCRKLAQVHESVGQLKKLVKLNLEHCRNLVTLPGYLETNNLEEFILGGCLMLEKLPEFGREMRSLYFFDMGSTGITEIPSSMHHLINLKYLDLTFCSRLKSIPQLPPDLIIRANSCPWLKPAAALPHLYASHVPKGPIHLFSDFQLWTRIPTWFDRWEYCWGKETSGEFVTITADTPSNVTECWGIAVCIVFQFLSQAWLGFSINWKFQDDHRTNKTKIHGTPIYYMHDCRVYVGFYPFDKEQCRQHPSGIGSQLDLTLCFPSTNISSDLHDLEIMGCGWRLACKKDFDEWRESKEP